MFFPNPANDYLQINFTENINDEIQVALFSVQGQRLLVQKINAGDNTLQLNVADYAAGIYFLRLSNDKGAHVQRVVVE